MSTTIWVVRAIITTCLFGAAATAAAADFQVASLSALYTRDAKADPVLGTGTANEHLTTYQFEYFGGFKYGDVYVDAEVFHGEAVGGPGAGSFAGNNSNQQLMVFNPRLSLGKMTGRDLTFGPISDVSLIARYERASYADFRSYNHGISLNFKVPGFAYFESGILRRNTNFYRDEWLWRSVLMSNALPIAGQKFHFNLLSLVNGAGSNGTEVFLRPELLWAIDDKGAWQLGLRHEVHRYKLNGQNYSRQTPSLMLKWTL
ncbi:hypothetical protein NHH82_27725 [Oxalobacteraceae bacterium OTU3REALA1]|nr:hypothetical protein NHH82_27725 [Oxalobacteraceae bacterium OTU3REALA1]